MTEFVSDGPSNAAATLVLAHGAGGGMRSAFMEQMAQAVSAAGIRVIRFEFPYMAAKRKRPDPQGVLLETWREVVAEIGGAKSLYIGGKSMGGRIASMVADELEVRGLVCLTYPFHPPGQPEKLRTAHLGPLRTPTLIVQGTKDPFGTLEEVGTYALSKSIQIEWVEGADHSFRKREYLEKAAGGTVTFVTGVPW